MRTVLPRGQGRADDSGTSLIEVIVALSVFSILAAALLSLLLSTATMVRAARQRVVAGQVVASVVDEARAQGAVTVAPGRTTTTRTVGATTFTVVRDAAFVARGASTGCASPGNPSFLRVHVEVSWTGMGSMHPVAADTLITPSIGEADRATGSLAVQVVDRNGAPAAGAPVTMSAGTTPGPGTTQLTTADGCAVFAFVAPGTYTASLSQPGWVDPQGQPVPAVSTSVTAAQTAVVQLQYDQAGDLRLVPATDPAHPAPDDLSWTLLDTAFTTPDHTRTFPPDGTLPLVVHGLFPAAAGYTGWAGACAAGDPGETARPAPVPVGHDAPATLVVPIARVEVDVRRSGPLPAGWQVTATRDAADGCAESHTFLAGSGGAVGMALPYGHWTFTVTSGAATAASGVVALAPATTPGPGGGAGSGSGGGVAPSDPVTTVTVVLP